VLRSKLRSGDDTIGNQRVFCNIVQAAKPQSRTRKRWVRFVAARLIRRVTQGVRLITPLLLAASRPIHPGVDCSDGGRAGTID
jgi:hypothetical protein